MNIESSGHQQQESEGEAQIRKDQELFDAASNDTHDSIVPNKKEKKVLRFGTRHLLAGVAALSGSMFVGNYAGKHAARESLEAEAEFGRRQTEHFVSSFDYNFIAPIIRMEAVFLALAEEVRDSKVLTKEDKDFFDSEEIRDFFPRVFEKFENNMKDIKREVIRGGTDVEKSTNLFEGERKKMQLIVNTAERMLSKVQKLKIKLEELRAQGKSADAEWEVSNLRSEFRSTEINEVKRLIYFGFKY